LYLLDLIPAPTWRDIVDILFLTIVAYQLYVWFRESRALRVIIGLVALGGIYSIAKFWDLFLTTWVFQILWQVLLILLLILFQAEIRQVLEKVSPMRYLRSRRRVFQKTFAKELTQTLFEMAADRTGALIVLARNDMLMTARSLSPKTVSPKWDASCRCLKMRIYRRNTAPGIGRPWGCPKSQMPYVWWYLKNDPKLRQLLMEKS
jgi:DNA integrity scanning protein DisA with diadenylate cyclase activity